MIQPLKINKKIDNDAKIASIIRENIPTTEYMSADEVNSMVAKINELVPAINVSNGGFQGTLAINEKRVDSGFYIPTESGTFINADNVKVDLSQGVNFVTYDGEKWDVAVVPVLADGKVEEGNMGFVSGDRVYTKIDEFYGLGDNLLNNLDIHQGTYVVSTSTNKIVLGNAVNWISIRIAVEPNTTYHLQGMSSFSDRDIDVVRFGDKDEYFIKAIKGTEGYKTFTTPNNCRFVYFPVENNIDIGNNPTSSIYFNTALMCLGSKDIEYVPYGFNLKENKIPSLDNTKVKNLDQAIANNNTVLKIENDIDAVLSKYDKLYRFNGVSYARLDNEYVLIEEGDYLEIRLRLYSSWTSFNDSLGIIGKGRTTRDLIGFYNKNTLWLRTATLNLEFSNLPIDVYELHTYRFKIESGFVCLYIDGDFFKKEIITEPIKLINVGDAYTASPKFELQYIIINNEFKELLQLEKVEVILEEKNSKSIGDAFNCYYEYTPSNTNGDRCIVYTKLEGTKDLFIGFYVYAFIKNDPLEYSNQIRIQGASVYKYMNSEMIKTGYKALVPSESEFTLLQKGKVDHTGGVHGDEIALNYKFMPDGKVIELGSKIELTPCTYFTYTQISNLHETANANTPNEPISGHPVIASHFKRTTFYDSGYKTQNVVKFLSEIEVVRTYTGLVCMHKDFATEGYNEYGDFAELKDKNNSQKMTSNYANIFYGSGNYGNCEIESHVVAIHKSNKKYIENEEPYRSSNQMWITDRTEDSKYYRLLGGTSGSILTELNEIWSLECNVRFKK